MRKPMHEFLKIAAEHGFAIAAPNVFNLESVEACFIAATITQAPIILDVGTLHGLKKMAHLVTYYEQLYPEVIFALNLDHGASLADVKQAIAVGFTSVMIDGSALSFADNVALTKEVVTYAHQYQISVEAELGHVGQGDIAYDFFTQPKQAEQFVQLTNVDALAVAIGTTHGLYKQVPQFDLQRLVQINNTVNIPLVLHGGSSSGAANLQAVIKNGITKINLFTDLGQASLDLMKQWLLADDLPALLRQYPDFNLKKANIHQMLTFGFTYGYKLKLIDYITLFKSANTLHLFQ